MKKMNKVLVIALAVCLLAMAAMGATLAWLMSTDTVTNTFTVGSTVKITLDESDNLDLDVMPGKVIEKDPTITVDATSENCWVFVKIESELTNKFTWEIAEGWTEVETNVWARSYTKGSGATYPVLKDNTVTVASDISTSETLGLSEMDMVISAYAIQADYLTGEQTAANAWTLLQAQLPVNP